MRPRAFKIDINTKKISYICSKCGTSLEVLGKNATYCYNCGVKLRWGSLPFSLEEKYKDKNLKDYMVHQEIINDINDHIS